MKLIHSARPPTGVTRGLVPRVPIGMAGTSPAMTVEEDASRLDIVSLFDGSIL
jgi:hypothetical protein